MNAQSGKGIWSEIKPYKLAAKDQKHSWLFAEYWEFPSERDDRCYYIVFLFRNEERTIFGMKESLELSGQVSKKDFRRFATHVIQDKEFRESLISDDSDLPKIWKRH